MSSSTFAILLIVTSGAIGGFIFKTLLKELGIDFKLPMPKLAIKLPSFSSSSFSADKGNTIPQIWFGSCLLDHSIILNSFFEGFTSGVWSPQKFFIGSGFNIDSHFANQGRRSKSKSHQSPWFQAILRAQDSPSQEQSLESINANISLITSMKQQPTVHRKQAQHPSSMFSRQKKWPISRQWVLSSSLQLEATAPVVTDGKSATTKRETNRAKDWSTAEAQYSKPKSAIGTLLCWWEHDYWGLRIQSYFDTDIEPGSTYLHHPTSRTSIL